MKITEADVIWVPVLKDHPLPHAGTVRVEHHMSGWQRTEGDRWMPAASAFEVTDKVIAKGNPLRPLLSLFILFNTITVRDSIPVQAAHAALLAIDEYAKAISPDTPGAVD
jgi:hypothetical protein